MQCQYLDDGEADNLNNEDNPFVDQLSPTLIGQGPYILEGLTVLIDNPCEINLIGQNYETHGTL